MKTHHLPCHASEPSNAKCESRCRARVYSARADIADPYFSRVFNVKAEGAIGSVVTIPDDFHSKPCVFAEVRLLSSRRYLMQSFRVRRAPRRGLLITERITVASNPICRPRSRWRACIIDLSCTIPDSARSLRVFRLRSLRSIPDESLTQCQLLESSLS